MELQIGDQVSAYFEDESDVNSKGRYMAAHCWNIKEVNGQKLYYISWNNVNKRFDEWLPREKIDFTTIVRKTAQKSKKGDNKAQQDENLRYLGLARNIEYLHFGDYCIKCWYFSPVPEPFYSLEKLYCCEFCMEFFSTESGYYTHCDQCKCTNPPGDEIYRNGNVSAYEVDGSLSTKWCTNLCLVTKLFLFHKTEYYDPTMFNFYVVCFNDERGAHPCGFFSKEKDERCMNNLACILAFPPYQNTGVGRFMIQLSYELSKIENKPGGPETPLSDLGMLAYKSYWKSAVMKVIIENQGREMSISDMVKLTGMTEPDIKMGIMSAGLLYKNERGDYVYGMTPQQVAEYRRKESRRKLQLDPTRIRWTPFPIECLNR